MIHQAPGINQGLLTAKSRLSKKGLTIPRQELVSAHMAANLIHNVKTALSGFPVRRVYCWLDSSVALHWLKGNGHYKQFVANRVRKIQQHDFIQWRHVKSEDNPADLGSRGGQVDVSADLWWQGQEWLTKPDCWPPDIVTHPTPETQVEAKYRTRGRKEGKAYIVLFACSLTRGLYLELLPDSPWKNSSEA